MIPTKTINLDFWRYPTKVLNLVQGESAGRTLRFNLVDGTDPFDLTNATAAWFAVKKSDETVSLDSAVIIDAENGIVEVTFSSQSVAAAGDAIGELQILTAESLTKSFNIPINIQQSVDTDGIPPSETELGVLQTLIGQAETVISIANTDLWPQVVENAQYFSDLAGPSRTTETVKGNANEIADHIADDENPHTVTLAQLGAAADADLTALAGAGRTNQTVKGNADDIADHIADDENPHTVTLAQLGAAADADLADLAGDGRTNQTVKANADAITNLAGAGRNTETVKGNADDIAALEAEIETARAGSATLADEIQKRTLLARYVHESNQEIYVTAVSTVDGTFTSNGHGLVNGNNIAITHNLDSFGPISTIFPAGITKRTQPYGYLVVNATENTFQLATTVGGAPIVPTSTGDVTKFHFEVSTNPMMSISNLPNLYRATVYVSGSSLVNGAQGYLRIHLNGNVVMTEHNNGINNSSLGRLFVPEPNHSVSEINISTRGRATAIRKTQRFDYETGAMTESSGHVMKYDKVNNLFNILHFINFFPANGLVIEVYES